MSAKKRILRGFQDLLPKKMLIRNSLVKEIKSSYEKFGFLPQDTPCLEYADLLLGKYGAGGERQIYKFRDQGNREIAMRYDLTVPLSRVISMYERDIVFPYRRYQIGKVWRADKPGKGRYREFTQIDADIIGDDSLLADVEIILLIMDIMENLGIKTVVKINSREVLNLFMEFCNLNQKKGMDVMRVIDKYEKIGKEGVTKELRGLGFNSSVTDKVYEYLSIRGTNKEIMNDIRDLLKKIPNFNKKLKRIEDIYKLLEAMKNVEGKFQIDPSIARGLDYYTGIIFETTFIERPEIGSICSGGRFDKLIKLNSGNFISAVGTSVGLDRLYDAMETTGLLPKVSTTTNVFMVNFGESDLNKYLKLASELRMKNIETEIYPKKISLSKQLQIASAKEIPVVLIMGSREITDNQIVIRDMKNRTQKKVPKKELLKEIKKIIK